MRARLVAVQTGHRMNSDKGSNRPVLRKHTEEDGPVNAPPDAQAPTATTTAAPADDHPTLKRTNSDPD